MRTSQDTLDSPGTAPAPGGSSATRVARTHRTSLIALWTPVAVALAMTAVFLYGNVTWMNETDFAQDASLVGLGAVLIVLLGAVLAAATAVLAVIGTCFTTLTTRFGLAVVGALLPFGAGVYVLVIFTRPGETDTADVTSDYGAAAVVVSLVVGIALSVVPVVVAALTRRRAV